MGIDEELYDVIETALKNQLSLDQICCLSSIQKKKWKTRRHPSEIPSYIFMVILGIILYFSTHDYAITDLKNNTCLVYHSVYTLTVTRPILKCSFCRDITDIDVVENITRDIFVDNYAYAGKPIVIKNGASNWMALKYVNITFLRKLYNNTDFYSENEKHSCQFFPYKTKFKHLKQVFETLDKYDENLKDGWYVGWGNCVYNINAVLRQHYLPVMFLPADSEKSNVDWFFMGSSGCGADMHIDSIKRPSWQAVISGIKTWYLEPPPECEHVCARHLNATLSMGDIIVINTNLWFHSTYIHPSHTGGLSLAIGSEYD